MRTMFAFFTGLYGKALSLGVKLLASGATLVTGLFTRLGVKLLSYGWIEKPFNAIKKALSIVKQVVFNQKVVVILKYLLAMGLCVVALIQLFFAGRTVYENIDTVIALVKMSDVSMIIFLVVAITGTISVLLLCLNFIARLFKKKIVLTFVPVVFSTYLLLRFLSFVLNNTTMISVAESFNLINEFAIVLLAYAFIKLFDKTYPVSFFGVVFAVVGIVVVFLVYKNINFGELINFEIIDELAFAGKDVDIVTAINGLINPEQAKDFMRIIVSGALSYSTVFGEFTSSVIIAVSVAAIIISHLLPYALLSCAIALVMCLVNERQSQYKYLSKAIKTLGIMLLSVISELILVLLITLIKTPKGVYFVVSQNSGALFFTLGMIIAVMIIAAIARALFSRKIYGKINKKSK